MKTITKTIVYLSLFIGIISVFTGCEDDLEEKKAVFSITPEECTFKELEVGKKKDTTFVITNQGDAVLKVKNIRLTGDNKEDFEVIYNPTSINGQKSYSFKVRFAPKKEGEKQATMIIDANDEKYKVLLKGKAKPKPVAMFSVTPKSWDFQVVKVGETKTKQFVIKNNSTSDLSVAKITLEGMNSDYFKITGGVGTIAPNKTLEFTASCKPTSMDYTTIGATVKITSSTGEKKEVQLTATILPADSAFSVTPKYWDFQTVKVGETKTKQFVIKNNSTSDLSVTQITLEGMNPNDFKITGGVGTIAPTGTLEFTASCKPTSMDYTTIGATVKITSSTGEKKEVQLTATILPADSAFSVTPKYWDFQTVKVGETKTKKFVIKNNSTSDLSVAKITLEGMNSDYFKITGGIGTIAPTGTLEFTASCKPTSMDYTTIGATVKITSSTGEEKKVDLTATILPKPQPIFSISPKNYDFGGLEIGKTATKKFVVKNEGDADLIISEYKIRGSSANQFSVTNCNGTIAPNGTKEIVVTFKPTTEPTATAVLELTTNAGKKEVSISGMPLPKPKAKFATDPANNYTFNATVIGTKDSQTILIKNDGDAPLTISSISLVGAQANQFKLDYHTTIKTIEGGKSNKFVAIFEPTLTTVASASAKIKFVTNIGEKFLTLEGKILAPQPKFSISPNTYSFNDIEIGKTSTKKFIIKNEGNADLIISQYELKEDMYNHFSVTDCNGTIAPNGTKELTVTFKPVSTNSSYTKLELTTNIGKKEVIIHGMGIMPMDTKIVFNNVNTPFKKNTISTQAPYNNGHYHTDNLEVEAVKMVINGSYVAAPDKLNVWPATLEMDLTNKATLRSVEALISTNGVPMVFKFFDINKNEIYTKEFNIPHAGGVLKEEKVTIDFTNIKNTKYVHIVCGEGAIKYIVFKY